MAEARQLGPYRLLRRIAQGGMGEVWEAIHTSRPGELVAVKTMLAGPGASLAESRKFVAEAQLGASLKHLNVARTVDLGLDGEHLYFAMELLHGCTLAELIRRHPRGLPAGAVALIADQVLQGLEYVHAAKGKDGRPLGLIHRDLKPSNLFVTEQGPALVLQDKENAVTASNWKAPS